ncbi:LysR substrate-binding domain-containing protein [Stenotrophomonas sp.]|uniref:LysR family transcriptional regulator n=1 Tax=Stenotrophomonas sp. TaxID=69392 RepID=UPI0028A6827E|nr:LysR substrate-binding domain-containing protein [Stenotrophomonas sp.]
MSSVLSSLESLNGLIAFASAVRAGSFSAAGRQLGLSASAVGKSVERLELRLGMRLLNRTTRSLALTGEGEVLYHYANKVVSDLQEAERELNMRQRTPRGRLKITASPLLGRKFVLPALRDFAMQHPEVDVALSLDADRRDIVEDGFDLALWAGELENSSLQARRLGSYALVTCASPRYLAEHGVPGSPMDLACHCCIHYRHPDNERLEPWRFRDGALPRSTTPDSALNDVAALASAALVGLGIVQLPDYVVREDVVNGRLLQVLGNYSAAPTGIFLVWPPMAAQVPRVRVFIDFIAKRASQEFSTPGTAITATPKNE